MSVRPSPSLVLRRPVALQLLRPTAAAVSALGRLRPSSSSLPSVAPSHRRCLSLTPIRRSAVGTDAKQDPYTEKNTKDDVNVKQKCDELAKIVKTIKVRPDLSPTASAPFD